MWPNPQCFAGLVTFAEEFLNGKLYFLSNTEITMRPDYEGTSIIDHL